MAKTCIQVLGWIFCMGSWGATIGVLLSHKWKQNSVEGLHHSTIDTVSNMEGLWSSCQMFPSGEKQCWPISGPIQSLPMVIVGCRTLLILAILIGLIAGVIALLGFKCVDLEPSSRKAKAKLARISGMMNLFSGVCVTIAGCWYIGNNIITPPPRGPRNSLLSYSLHEAVQICIAFGLLWCGASVLLICGSRHQDDDPDANATNNYEPRKTVVKQEYI